MSAFNLLSSPCSNLKMLLIMKIILIIDNLEYVKKIMMILLLSNTYHEYWSVAETLINKFSSSHFVNVFII